MNGGKKVGFGVKRRLVLQHWCYSTDVTALVLQHWCYSTDAATQRKFVDMCVIKHRH